MVASAAVIASGVAGLTDAGRAELVSAAALVILSGLLYLPSKKPAIVTADTVTYTRPSTTGIAVTLNRGAVIPEADVPLVAANQYRRIRISRMRSLVIGADNRTSTSKCVALAWTYALVFGLFALLVAKWLGDSAGYDALVASGVQPEYWLFLGGPYAAAIAAKVATTSQSDGSGKTSAPVDGATLGQLVVNDEGNGDLGDFQYVIFNLLALVYFVGAFAPHLNDGLPDLPKVLTGLALTSAGAYSAKKFLAQAPPTLTSVFPTSLTEKSTFQLWGNNLIVPASVTPDGAAAPPIVMVGGIPATVSASQETMGADHLTVQLPEAVRATAATQFKVTAVRADGIAATGPGGTDGLALTITPAAPPTTGG